MMVARSDLSSQTRPPITRGFQSPYPEACPFRTGSSGPESTLPVFERRSTHAGNEPILNLFPTVLVAISMNYREVSGDREFVARLAHGADWREEIESLADEESIDAAWFLAMGAVQNATVWFYDQSELEYREVEFDEPLEVASCVGNIAWLDVSDQRSDGSSDSSDGGERFAHTHAVLSRKSGQTLAGHLDSATVFAGELYVRSFADELKREHHEPTDLDLWL
jgi:predicted DNA-binding protein with PD1-like motif